MKAIISVIIIILILTVWYFVLIPGQKELSANNIGANILKLSERVSLLEKKCSDFEKELLIIKKTFKFKKVFLYSFKINGKLFFLSKNVNYSSEQNILKLSYFTFLQQYNGEKIDMKKIIYCKYTRNNGKIYNAKIENNKIIILELSKNKKIQNIQLVRIVFKSIDNDTYTSNTSFNIRLDLNHSKTKNIHELPAKKITDKITQNPIIILDNEKFCFCIKGKLAVNKNNVSDIWNIENRTNDIITITTNSSQTGLKIKVGNIYHKIKQQSSIKYKKFQLCIFPKQLRKGISELPYQISLLTSKGKKIFYIWKMPNTKSRLW